MCPSLQQQQHRATDTQTHGHDFSHCCGVDADFCIWHRENYGSCAVEASSRRGCVSANCAGWVVVRGCDNQGWCTHRVGCVDNGSVGERSSIGGRRRQRTDPSSSHWELRIQTHHHPRHDETAGSNCCSRLIVQHRLNIAHRLHTIQLCCAAKQKHN